MNIRVWSYWLLFIPLLVYLYLGIIPVHAQSQFAGEGRVVAVDESKGIVTLDHGPIPGLMPAMRMTFPVQPVDLLQGIQVGTMVQFSLQPRGPEWVIVTLEPSEEQPPPRPAIFPAPDFTLPALSGETLRLSDFRGKVVLLNFWATWCVPCRQEMPTIEALYQRYKDRGLEVVAVNLDKRSTADVEAFVKEVQVTFRVVLDPEWTIMQAYRVRGLPTTFLIDRAGNIVAREMGERDWMAETQQQAIEKLLQEEKAAKQR